MANHNQAIWTVVPAAGIGQRMHASVPKQYLKIHNRTILEHTVDKLLSCEELKHVTVCIAQHDTIWPTLSLFDQPQVNQTLGGATRAHSVLNALRFIADKVQDDDWILVHDAARPCFSKQNITKLIDSLVQDKVGGLLAIPAKDTLKQTILSSDGVTLCVKKTLDRKHIWRAQTPQMFRYGLLNNALTSALTDGVEVTDEASAIEYAGYQAKLVEGDENNLKITTPDDLTLAEILLKE